jgi:hypothetical protein
MSSVTYGQLENALRSLGFTLCGVVEKNKVFLHEPTGAIIVYPEFPPDQEVYPSHELRARAVLDAYGIVDRRDFAALLQQPVDAPPAA